MDVSSNLADKLWQLKASKDILELEIGLSALVAVLLIYNPHVRKQFGELQKSMHEVEPYKTQFASLDAAIALLEQEVRYDEQKR